MNIGEVIRKIRKQQGLTQKELAKYAGISQSALTYYEKNQRTPSVKALKSIARALNVSITTLSPDDICIEEANGLCQNMNEKQIDVFIKLFSSCLKANNIEIQTISDARLIMFFANFLLDLDRENPDGIHITSEFNEEKQEHEKIEF